MRRVELDGQQFGDLSVVRFGGTEAQCFGVGTSAVWECKCKCGARVIARSRHLRNGSIKRCRECRAVNLKGQTFGRLFVIEMAFKPKNRVSTKARWLCRCECGKSVITRTDSLRNGRATSCGCWLHGSRLPNHGAAWNQVISKLKGGAGTRGIPWELSSECAFRIIRSNCHYCNAEPFQPRSTKQDSVLYMGIDRIDSSRGYVEDNVLPCCRHCNCAKNTMSYEEFKSWIVKVYRHMDRKLTALHA